MPRKTKKQKILAKLHRLEQITKEPVPEKKVQISIPSSQEKKVSAPSNVSATVKLGQDYTYVYKDLRKILILSFLAIGIEIVLSLTASNSYAKLVLRTLNLDF